MSSTCIRAVNNSVKRVMPQLHSCVHTVSTREGGGGGGEGGRERKRGREEEREEGREGGRKGGREGGREGGRKEGREEGRERSAITFQFYYCTTTLILDCRKYTQLCTRGLHFPFSSLPSSPTQPLALKVICPPLSNLLPMPSSVSLNPQSGSKHFFPPSLHSLP
jgi:hypothetical protein